MRGLVWGISTAALSAVALSSGSYAADIPGPSKIDAVTVYPSGADITRVLKVKIPAGEHTVVVNDLPAGALPQSIRIDGKATGGALQIGSVDTRRVAVPRADSATIATQRRAMEDEIEKLKDQRALLQTEIQAAEAQKPFIQNLAALPSRPITGSGTVAEPDWLKIAALISERSAAV
ncbi:MAG: DUF4140 domain-containing protein, partial [Hyphomicrobiaceae bacterium]